MKLPAGTILESLLPERNFFTIKRLFESVIKNTAVSFPQRSAVFVIERQRWTSCARSRETAWVKQSRRTIHCLEATKKSHKKDQTRCRRLQLIGEYMNVNGARWLGIRAIAFLKVGASTWGGLQPNPNQQAWNGRV